MTTPIEDLVFDNNSSPHSLSWAKLPTEVVDETAARLLLVSLSIEVDELATKVAELEDRTDRAANEGGAGLGRK